MISFSVMLVHLGVCTLPERLLQLIRHKGTHRMAWRGFMVVMPVAMAV